MQSPGSEGKVTTSWNFICDICGQKWKARDGKKTWDGFRTCPKCYDPKHPQISIRGVKDTQSVPWSRPDVVIGLDDNGVTSITDPTLQASVAIDVVIQGVATADGDSVLTDANASFNTMVVAIGDVVIIQPKQSNPNAATLKFTVTSVDSDTQVSGASGVTITEGDEYTIRRYDNRITGDDL